MPKPPLAAASSRPPLTRGTPGPITPRPTGACNRWLAAHRIPPYCLGHLCTWPLGFECLWYQLGLFPLLVKQGLVGQTVSHRNGRTKGDQRYMYCPDLLHLKTISYTFAKIRKSIVNYGSTIRTLYCKIFKIPVLLLTHP